MAREIVIKGHTFKSILLDGQRYVLEREVAPYIKQSGQTVRAKAPCNNARAPAWVQLCPQCDHPNSIGLHNPCRICSKRTAHVD